MYVYLSVYMYARSLSLFNQELILTGHVFGNKVIKESSLFCISSFKSKEGLANFFIVPNEVAFSPQESKFSHILLYKG